MAENAKEPMSEIKLALLIVGGIAGLTIVVGAGLGAARPDDAKEIFVAASAVGSSAITGVLGWMGRGLYETVKAKLNLPEEAKEGSA